MLTPSIIFDNTDIEEDEIKRTWDVNDVQRYAARYKWDLIGGDKPGQALAIVKNDA